MSSTGTENIDLTFLARQNEKLLAEVGALRREVNDIRTLTIGSVEYGRRLDRKINEVKDDMELMLKSELSGRFAHFETRLSSSLDRIVERLDDFELKSRNP